MVTRVGAAARRAGLSVEEFQRHWRAEHGPTAGAIPGLRRYVQHHGVLVAGRSPLPYPGFDACSELDFDSPAAMDQGFAAAAAQGELQADEDRFVDKSRYSWVLGEVDVRQRSVQVAEPVTLVTWWRSHPAATVDRLVGVLTGAWEAAIGTTAATVGRRLIAARPDWHAGRQPPSADVVEVVELDGVDAALAFLGGPLQDAGPLLAGVAFGAERHLARPVTITG